MTPKKERRDSPGQHRCLGGTDRKFVKQIQSLRSVHVGTCRIASPPEEPGYGMERHRFALDVSYVAIQRQRFLE